MWTRVKNSGIKAKLQGEIALLDRQVVARHKKFGIELYDIIDRLDKDNAQLPMLLGGQSKQIKQIFDTCQLSTRQLVDEKDAKEGEIEHLQVNRERQRPVSSASEKLSRAGAWVSSNSSEAKLQAEIALIERKIRQRKETFGEDVYMMVINADPSSSSDGGAAAATAASPTTSPSQKKKGLVGGIKAGIGGVKAGIGGVKSGVTDQLASKLSGPEKEIQQCIDRSNSDISYITGQKTRKQREIARLDQESAAA